ncbi:MAG: copper ion binding protein [Thermoleophilia bacterium]
MTSTRIVLDVPAISCMHCKKAIEGAVGALAGVASVDVDVAEKSVSIDYDADHVTLEAIEAAIADEGYEVAGRR